MNKYASLDLVRRLASGIFLNILFCLVAFDLRGGDLARRVQEAYRQAAVLRADFVQKTWVDLLEREIEERGDLTLARPDRFRIRYLGPHQRKYLSNGRTLWMVRPGEETERIVNLEAAVSREALAFLSGLGEMGREFKVAEDRSRAALTLVPRSPESPFKKILLAIDPGTGLAREATLYPRRGNRSHYFFSRVRTGGKVSADEFHP